jgi:hypothetical protein
MQRDSQLLHFWLLLMNSQLERLSTLLDLFFLIKPLEKDFTFTLLLTLVCFMLFALHNYELTLTKGGPQSDDPNAVIYGTRMRLKEDFDPTTRITNGVNDAVLVVIAALKKYGMYLVDGVCVLY